MSISAEIIDLFGKIENESDYKDKETLFHFTSLNINYGLTDKLVLSGNIGYFLNTIDFSFFDAKLGWLRY